MTTDHIPAPPRHAPLRYEQVHALAEHATKVLTSAMLTDQPEPLAAAAWQAQIALSRIAEALNPNPPTGQDRAERIIDLAARGDLIRQYAHRWLAAEQSPAELAAAIDEHQQAVYDVQALVTAATLKVVLPNGTAIAVELGTTGHQDPTPGWTTWHTDSPYELAPVTPVAHLEIAAALDTIGEAFTRAHDDAAFDDPR